MNRSSRLQALIRILRPAPLLIDIGCDHGYSCIEAVSAGKAERCLACDLRTAPLQRAAENIAAAGLSDRISCCLSDGFRSVRFEETEAACIISGMGGRLITDILKYWLRPENEKASAIRQYILSPQSEPAVLRHYLIDEAGLFIDNEITVEEKGKYYPVLSVSLYASEASGSSQKRFKDEFDYQYGITHEKSSLPVFCAFLRQESRKLQEAIASAETHASGERGKERVLKLRHDLEMLEQTVQEYEKEAL